MTHPDLTPEAVERLAKSLAFVANRTGLTVEKCEQITDDSAATLRALSSALENAVAEAHATGAERAHWKARAEALDAKLNEAVDVIKEGMACTKEHGGAARFLRIARAALRDMDK